MTLSSFHILNIAWAVGFLSLDSSSGQSISQPAVSCSGTTLQVTSSVDPVSPVFAFQWVIDVGNGNINLASVGLDNAGGVNLVNNNNDYDGTYSVNNNPNMLNPITAEFETTLSSPNAALLSAACSAPDVSAITIGVMASPIDQRIQIQCSMTCVETTASSSTTSSTTSTEPTTTSDAIQTTSKAAKMFNFSWLIYLINIGLFLHLAG